MHVSVKLTVVGVAGAVRFCVPLVDNVPRPAHPVPVPPEGVQLVVFVELHEIEKALLTCTDDGLTPKELITGVVFGAVHSFRFPAEDRRMTLPVAASMLIALVVDDEVSAMAGTLSSDRFWATKGLGDTTVAARNTKAETHPAPVVASLLSTCTFLDIR